MNLPHPTPTRNPRRLATRRSQQCSRPGWRGRKLALSQHAANIAAAIRRHRAAGNARWIQPHEYTPNAKTQALVHELLAAEAAPEAVWQ